MCSLPWTLCLIGLFALRFVSCEDKAPAFCHGIDCPKYKLLEKNEDYEVRRYHAAKWVSTEVDQFHFLRAQQIGFNRLFSYISGANKKETHIPMTSPVRTLVNPGSGYFCETLFTVSFFVPFDYQDAPPKPSSSDVFIEDTPAMTVYVKSYGGFMREDNIIQYGSELISLLQKKGISVITDQYYASGYDPPFRLIGRHNELWIIANETTQAIV